MVNISSKAPAGKAPIKSKAPARKTAAKTAVATKAAPRTAAKAVVKAPAKTAVKAAPKPVAKSPAKPALPVTKATPAAKPAVAAAPKAPKLKHKLVRDSFTMPKADFDLIAVLKERSVGFKQPAKKSELLRAGLQVLSGLSDDSLKAALGKLEALKPGRPKAPQA